MFALEMYGHKCPQEVTDSILSFHAVEGGGRCTMHVGNGLSCCPSDSNQELAALQKLKGVHSDSINVIVCMRDMC